MTDEQMFDMMMITCALALFELVWIWLQARQMELQKRWYEQTSNNLNSVIDEYIANTRKLESRLKKANEKLRESEDNHMKDLKAVYDSELEEKNRTV